MSYLNRLNKESQIMANEAYRKLQKEKRERKQLDLKRLLYKDIWDNYKPKTKADAEQFFNKIELRTKILLEQKLIVQIGTETLITEEGIDRLVKYACKQLKQRYNIA